MRNTAGVASVALRVVVIAGALLIGLGMVAAPAQPTGAAAADQILCGYGDTNGGGDDDLVVGVPKLYGSTGLVDIRTTSGVSRTLSLPYGDIGDQFGAAVDVVGVDGDGCNDLVVGAPGRGGTGRGRTGAVYLFFSTAAGTGTGNRVRLPYAGSPGDGFGSSLAVEGRPWTPPGEPVVGDVRIWVGIPGRDVAGQADAGAVAYYRVSALGEVSGPTLFTQNSAGVRGRPEAGDRFGQVLAPVPSGVLVGQPSEDIGTKIDAGLVTALPAPGATPTGPGPYVASEDTAGMPGVAEAGDRFGAAITAPFSNSIWVGAPGEDVGVVSDAGMVHHLAARATSFRSLEYISQNSPGVPGANEPGDHFGASLTGVYYEDCAIEVAIGAPGEDLGDVKDAGTVTASETFAGGECGGFTFSQGSNAREGDRFGAALMSQPSGDGTTVMIIGIPGQDLGNSPDVGAVVTGDFYPNRMFTLSSGSEPRTRYGSVIAKFALNY